MVSTSRILVAVVKMCYEAKDWDALNENIILLSKRRSQLKQVRFCLVDGHEDQRPSNFDWLGHQPLFLVANAARCIFSSFVVAK